MPGTPEAVGIETVVVTLLFDPQAAVISEFASKR
jgi:hypothetical protein